MRTLSWRQELRAQRRRSRWTLAASALAHGILFLLVPRPETGAQQEYALEVIWLEEPAPSATLEAPAPPARIEKKAAEGETKVARSAPKEDRVQFERPEPAAPVKPEPQIRNAARDRVRAQLASLDPLARDQRTQIAQAKTERWERTITPSPSAASPENPKELVRRSSPDTTRTPPRTLRLSDPLAVRPRALEPLATPQAVSKSVVEERQVLAGVTLSGPVTDRRLLSYRPPRYPEAAKREAIEGSVQLHFVVLPSGGVKNNVLVEKTSGFEDLDRNAELALLDWRFEPLPLGTTGEQWGKITLNYRLEDAR